MKAWQLHDTKGIDSYQLDDVPEPQPGPGEVRIALKTAGLNHLDIWVAQGLPAPKSFPHISGADGAGVVDGIGDGVSGFDLGDEIIIDPSLSCGHCSYCRSDRIVFCDEFGILGEHRSGTFTEKVVIPVINAIRRPPQVEWDVAGSFGLAGVTALRMLERSGVRRHDKVLIVGIGGGVSAMAMQLSSGPGRRCLRHVTISWQDRVGAVAGCEGWVRLEHGVRQGNDRDGRSRRSHRQCGAGDAETVRCGRRDRAARSPCVAARVDPKFELSLPVIFFRQLELIGSSMGNHAQFQRTLNWDQAGEGQGTNRQNLPIRRTPFRPPLSRGRRADGERVPGPSDRTSDCGPPYGENQW